MVPVSPCSKTDLWRYPQCNIRILIMSEAEAYIFEDNIGPAKPHLYEVPREDKNDISEQIHIDIINGTYILGGIALGEYLEAGGHPADVVPLAKALVDESIQLPEKRHRAGRNSFDREAAITDGRFLVNLVHSYDPEASVSARLMERAYSLGVIKHSPSQVRKPSTFGSYLAFQEAVGEENQTVRRRFDNFSFDDLVEHVQRVGQEEGCKPTVEIFDKRAEERDEPSSTVIRRLIAPKSFFELYEAAGYSETTHHWSNERIELVGVSYIWANEGRVPSARALNSLKRRGLSPTQHSAYGRYGTLSNYQDSVIARFGEQFNSLLSELESGLKEGVLPMDIIKGVKSEWEMVTRYIKYKLISETAGKTIDPDSLIAASIDLGRLPDAEFLNNYPFADLETARAAAKERGLEGAVWPKVSGLFLPKIKNHQEKVIQPEVGALKRMRDIRKEISKRKLRLRNSIFHGPPSEKQALYLKSRGEEIREALAEGKIPMRLFRGVKGGKDMVRRYETFSLLEQIGDTLTTDDKVRLTYISKTADELAKHLQKASPQLNGQKLKDIAFSKGLISLV